MNAWLLPVPFDSERDDWGATLLAEWGASVVTPGQHALVIGAGTGRIGLALARAGAHVSFADDSIVALAAARQSFAQAKLPAQFFSTTDLKPSKPFDLVLINILWWSDNQRGAELINLAAQHTNAGGIVAIGGGKQAGLSGATTLLESIVGPSVKTLYKKGHHVVMAFRSLNWQAQPSQASQHTLTHGDNELTIEATAGVFAQGQLDPASAMLLDAVHVQPNQRVLDLGCGAGILGMFLQRREATLDLTYIDSTMVAIEATKRNLQTNQLAGRVLASDGTQAISDEQFDLVVSNPPFHVGRVQSPQLAENLLKQAAQVLAPNGQLVIVANRFLRYEPLLEAALGNVRELAGDQRYKVLLAERKIG
ncbi:methyltransferase [Herpetosiphon giganteus]|uniref:methyltransferase n=1 Tax=Herpetosiphon giganteus TaxID=2029754 RepID=UPI001956580D|nr:methyltransferase [Herpetosiphon giganteus]MBM7842522.1 16S rRNA (guanine1207-N2)-methyltransferase [Herpetosiphon giganteus]